MLMLVMDRKKMKRSETGLEKRLEKKLQKRLAMKSRRLFQGLTLEEWNVDKIEFLMKDIDHVCAHDKKHIYHKVTKYL